MVKPRWYEIDYLDEEERLKAYSHWACEQPMRALSKAERHEIDDELCGMSVLYGAMTTRGGTSEELLRVLRYVMRLVEAFKLPVDFLSWRLMLDINELIAKYASDLLYYEEEDER